MSVWIKIPFVILFVFLASCGSKKSNSKIEEGNDKTSTVKVEIIGEERQYRSDTLLMKGYMAYDKKLTKKVPGILVVHEWWGHNQHARKRADMLATMGYVAFAVDMYGGGKQAQHPQEAGQFAGSVMKKKDQAQKRFEAALVELQQHPSVDASQIGAIGFCFGGSVVLSMANAGYDLDAVVAFHSGVQLPIWPEKDSVKARVLVLNGKDDPMISEEDVANFKAKMDEANADYQYVSYKGVKHAYTNKNAKNIVAKFPALGKALVYDAKADSASWNEMKTLFSAVF